MQGGGDPVAAIETTPHGRISKDKLLQNKQHTKTEDAEIVVQLLKHQ